MMKKGVILEVTRSYIVVLTPEGEFLKGRKDREEYEIGSEVPIYPVVTKKEALFKSSNWGAGLALAAVLMLCFAVFAPFLSAPKAFAYVSIDVNPSVELTVDENNKVIAARPFNNDGERILRHIKKVEKRTVEEVTADIISQMEALGYVKENKEIIIAAVPAGNHSIHIITDLENKLQTRDLPIAYVEASSQEREAANEQGITTGKYIQKMRIKEDTSSSEKVSENEKAESRKPINQQSQEKQDEAEQQRRKDKIEAEREAEEAREKAHQDQLKSEEKEREKQEKSQRKENEEREKAEQKAKEEKEKAERKAREEKEKAERKAKEDQEKAERKAREEREKAEEKKRKEQEKFQQQIKKKEEEVRKQIQKELEKRKKEQEKEREDDDDKDDDDDD